MDKGEPKGALWGEDKPAPVRLFWALSTLELACVNLATCTEHLHRDREQRTRLHDQIRDVAARQITENANRAIARGRGLEGAFTEAEQIQSQLEELGRKPLPEQLVAQCWDRLALARRGCEMVREAIRAGGAAPLDDALNPGARAQQVAILRRVQDCWTSLGGVEIVLHDGTVYQQADLTERIVGLRAHAEELGEYRESLMAAMEAVGVDPWRKPVGEGPSVAADVDSPLTPELAAIEQLTESERVVWNALDGQVLNAQALADLPQLRTNPDVIRQHVGSIRKKLGQESITLRKTFGYFRPDSPPDWENTQRAKARRRVRPT
ncbi:MAG: hypothetical protein HND58_14755 [Planctomycetota bacterium]|nr:MAG: hypothetical protein HND58_14755 [Planctomycetota bacterium]